MSDLDLARALDTARRAVEAASAAALAHFRAGVKVEVKPDRTPVTAADRDSEAAILKVIRPAFPEHGVLGEETGEHPGDGETRWIVDPIDGTRGFTRGGSFWGPLVACEHRGRIVAGAMAMPALGEVYWAAKGMGCFLQRGAEPPVRLQVSGIPAWGDATVSLGELHFLLGANLSPPIVRLTTSAAQARCYGDLAGCAMVLTGRAEAWIEAGVKIWDLAPLQILVEEAGGRFTDFSGKATVASGHCVASNGKVHDHVLAALRQGYDKLT
ncbi:inositol monophosphatase family protein [Anaeromyxobacter paludicola]|uniref:Histidinol-phosphatase n=1 Tax=Anaeromyxobacter paludicola TaxID=2918171 RepID=A0ABN6N4G9_9BACT|nr:inositol monophosphatase family protein [Anaeromyxobacter paludicola]BDG08064.1 histidinol-phosphatase [Anaeromyxobacter paludicola]